MSVEWDTKMLELYCDCPTAKKESTVLKKITIVNW